MKILPGTEMIHGSTTPTLSATRPRSDEKLTVTIVLWPKSDLKHFMAKGDHLSVRELAVAYGADPSAIKKVEDFAVTRGLSIVESSLEKRTVQVSGTVSQMELAFGVALGTYLDGTSTYRGYASSIHLPDDLVPLVVTVMGLENRQSAKPAIVVSAITPSFTGSCTALDIATAYRFPMANKGANQCVGIIELKGGYRPADLDIAFSTLGIQKPNFVDVPANHPTHFGMDPNADLEVALDMQVVGAIAPLAKIVLFFSTSGASSQGFHDTLASATTDASDPSVLSISWGIAESLISTADLAALRLAYQAAQQRGITVLAASGDQGSITGSAWPPGFEIGEDGKPRRAPLNNQVSHPACDPSVLSCGGTTLTADGATVQDEKVWNNARGASGGGTSQIYPVPAWQDGADVGGAVASPNADDGDPVVGRGVPDIAGHADGATGYRVTFNGTTHIVGGTSCVAPLFSGLVALINSVGGRKIGFINDVLYANPQIFRDVTAGSNAGYRARPGWDACTGLGSPDGMKLARLFLPAQSPTIRVSPAQLDFGSVRISGSAQGGLTIFNDGAFEDLNLQLTVDSAPQFSLSAGQPSSLSIAAGSSSVVGLAFSPVNNNPSQGRLLIASNDANNGQVNVALTGTTQPADQCAPIARQIKALQADILTVQAAISSGDIGKSDGIQQIADDRTQIAALRQQGNQLGCTNLP